MTPTKVNIENENKPITLSWENIDIYTPSSHEGFTGKIKKNVCFFKKEEPSKNIVKKGLY